MNLIDLKPQWFQKDATRKGTAIWFLCPCGKCGCGIVVPFQNPVDGGSPDGPDVWGKGLTDRWLRKGEDFSTLTIEPSILMWEDKARSIQHWHGWITNGEVKT